ncbi:MAG: hypothetical protein LBU65_00765 [Planctomycetaceae bacterium]|jgi:hypothetical protein|nr:hypothetical protein [Planctomycetaceae bacterium]
MWDYLLAVPPSTFLTLGLLILAVTVIRRARVYYSKTAERRRMQNEVAKGQPQVISERDPKRGLPRTNVRPATSVTPTFTGEQTHPKVAQWEIRIHEVGRQTLAQMNTKLAAMQVMLNEIKRANDRAESLISELERFSYENQAATAQLQTASNNAVQVLPQTNEQTTENVKQSVEQTSENIVAKKPVVLQPVMSELETIADESIELNSFRSVLDELTQEQSQWRAEMENLQESLPVPTQTIIPTPDEKQSYQETISKASVLRPYPVGSNAVTHKETHRPELPPLPDISPLTLPSTKPQPTPSEHPQFESLFASTSPRQVPGNKISPETRQDIFLLSDYGYSEKEIAHKVNVSIDEVQRTINSRTTS